MKQNKVPKNEYTNGEPSPYRKNPFNKDVFYGDDGQYAHPGQVTRIPGDAFGTHITMEGINQPLYARDDQGNEQMMQPGEDYTFPGQYVTEYPQMQTAQYGRQVGDTLSPEGWGIQIRNIEHQIGNPNQWTLDSYKLLQDKLNAYKKWRENTPTGKAVVDYHNEPNEYVVPLPEHLRNKKYGGGLLNKTLTCPSCGWSWKAVDGGKDIATCHKCGGTAKLAYGGLHKAQKGEQIEDNDSWLENIAEIVDPTGISSWDDMYRAYKNSGVSKELALEILGAIPFLGKVSKVTKPGIHLTKYSGIDQILKNTLPRNKSLSRAANVASKTGRGTDAVQTILGAKDNSGFTWDMRHGEVPMYNGRNIFPQIQLGEHGDFAYGGDPSLPMAQEGFENQEDPIAHLKWGKYIDDPNRRKQHIVDVYQYLMDSRWDPKNIVSFMKNVGGYGSKSRGSLAKSGADWGWDNEDITNEVLGEAWDDYYNKVRKIKSKQAYGGNPSLPNIEGHYQKGGTKVYTDKALFDKAYKAETDSLNAYNLTKHDPRYDWINSYNVKFRGKSSEITEDDIDEPYTSYYHPDENRKVYTTKYRVPLSDKNANANFSKFLKQTKLKPEYYKNVKEDNWYPNNSYRYTTDRNGVMTVAPPSTPAIENEINRAALKKKFPAVTDAFIDQQFEKRKALDPHYQGIITVDPTEGWWDPAKKQNGPGKGFSRIDEVTESISTDNNRAIPYWKKPVIHNVFRAPEPEHLEMKPTSLPTNQEEREIIAPKQVTKSDTTGKRIAWRMDPQTKKMVPLIGGMKEKVKDMKRLYNKYIPSSTGAIPADFNPDYGNDVVTFQEGGWLDAYDDEYRRGGQRRRGTSKNIQSSINDIFRRNYDVFGPGGKRRYNPRARYEEGGDLPEAQLGKIITRPLTLLTKTEMLSKKGKNMGYRKIGNVAGLQDLIRKKGAQAPAPMKMRSGLYADTPFFGMGKKPNENYKGIYAVEVDPHNPKYNWTSRVAGTDNLGVAPINPKTGELIKNIPLEDLNVYRKKWFSDNYKRLDPENLEEGLKNAKLQSGLENAWKWGVRGTAAVAAHDYMSKDSDDWAPQIQNYLNIKQKGGNNISESTFVRKPIVNIKKPNRQPTADDLAWYSMMAAQERQPDVLQQKQAQGKGSKAWDIMMNPFTAAGHMYQHGSIPDNFTQGPTSALDIAPQFVNPVTYAEMIYNTGKAAVNPQTYKDMAKTAQGLGMKAMGKEGPEGWQEAGLNTLGIGLDAAFALPGLKMAKGLKKNIGKSINKSINKTAKDVKKGVSENIKNYSSLESTADAVRNIKNKIASQKADTYQNIRNLRAERPDPNKFLSGEKKLNQEEIDFISKNPPTEGFGFYKNPTDPNYLYNFKTHPSKTFEQMLSFKKKKMGGWLDNLH